MPAKKKSTSASGSKKVSGTPSKKKSISRSRHKGAEKRKGELPAKRKRQYKHVLESEKKEGRSEKTAKRIAMSTVNKTRRKKAKLNPNGNDGVT